MESRLVSGVRGRFDPVVICLVFAVGLSAAIVLGLGSHLIFFSDDWELLLNRRGSSAGDLLDPFHAHIVLAPAVIYKLLLSTFGMSSALPFNVVAISLFLLSAVLLFVHLRPRVGDWPAFLAAVLILFLGAAFELLLWPTSVAYFGSVAAGLGMLIALDRDDRLGDRVACGLLTVSLAFFSAGFAFAAGALVDLALSRRPRAARAYVALLPLGLYGLWWLGWGHTDHTFLSWDNLANMPEYVFNAAAAGITSLLGLAAGFGQPVQPGLGWGQILLVGALGVAAFRVSRGARISRDLAIVLAVALTFWILLALDTTPERPPTLSRYQYPSAVFLLLIAGEALRGFRITTPALAVGGLVTAAAVGGGLSLLHQEYSGVRWKGTSDSLRASLAAVEIARDSLNPAFSINLLLSANASPQTYLAAVDDHGSPAYSESELLGRPDVDRAAADSTLASALGIRLAPSAGTTARCQTVQASPAAYTGVTLLGGGFTLTNEGDADAEVLLGRFSDGFPVDLGPLSPGSAASLTIPVDRSIQEWRLGLTGEGPVELCSTAPAPNP